MGLVPFVDEGHRRVIPRSAPTRRIVSLAPSVTELLFSIGAGDQVVGIDNYSDQPAGLVESIPKVGSDYEPSLETIVRMEPDVVFTSMSANRRETVESLDRMGVPVFVTDTRTLRDLDLTLRNLGAVTGHLKRAEDQISSLAIGFDRVRRRVRGHQKPRVLVVIWDDPLYVAGSATFTDDLIEMAGGTNVAADAVGFAKYPLERVLHAAADVIVLPSHAPKAEKARETYWSRWSGLPAVKDKRVYVVEDALIIRPGPRLVQGAELLAGLINPERPPDPPSDGG